MRWLMISQTSSKTDHEGALVLFNEHDTLGSILVNVWLFEMGLGYEIYDPYSIVLYKVNLNIFLDDFTYGMSFSLTGD